MKKQRQRKYTAAQLKTIRKAKREGILITGRKRNGETKIMFGGVCIMTVLEPGIRLMNPDAKFIVTDV